MRELFELTKKHGFKAPLVSVSPDFNYNAFMRMCNSLNVSPTTTAVASNIFIALQSIDEQMASLEYVATKIDKKPTVVRHHLTLLEKIGLVESEFITTDLVRKRRGKLFYLVIPTSKSLSQVGQITDEELNTFRLVPSNTVSAIDIGQYDDNSRFLELNIVRYLVKAMRTNRKDTSNKISIEVRNDINEKPIKITARAEQGRLVYLPDLSYYAGTITWLVNHIKTLLDSSATIGETYTLPLEPIISLSKNINMHDASGGGYVTNAIESLKRISGTTFDMTNLKSHFSSQSIIDAEVFYKMFRLEAIVTFSDERGTEKKAAVIQFPKSTIQNIVEAIQQDRILKELLLFDSELFSTNNEIEILFSLWARDQVVSGNYKNRIYTWNELRESVAPTSSLSEFKRKFTSVILANADPDYAATSSITEYRRRFSPVKGAIDTSIANKVTEQVGTTLLSGKKRGDRVVEYGRAAVQGFLINIGYSPEHGSSIISFRRDMSGMNILRNIGSNL